MLEAMLVALEHAACGTRSNARLSRGTGIRGWAHILQAEVPLEVGVDEGSHKAPAGSIHVDADRPAMLLVQLACKACSLEPAV